MTKQLKTYEFAVPGAVGYEKVQAVSQEEAKKIAEKMCESHSFLGGKVQPMVKEVK